MQAVLLSVLVGILGGVAIGFQNPLASLMGQRLGILEATFVIHAGGTILAGALLLPLGGGALGAWRVVPWYALGAGALGVVLIGSIAFTIPRIGVAATVALVVAAQLVIGVWLDHVGLLETAVRPLSALRLLGCGLLLGGAWLVLR